MFTMCSPCISSCVHCVYSLTPLQYVLLHCTPSLADSHIGCVCSSTGLLSPLYCVMWLVCGCIVLWLLICCYGNVWGVEICTDHVPVMLPPATVLYMSSCVVLCQSCAINQLVLGQCWLLVLCDRYQWFQCTLSRAVCCLYSGALLILFWASFNHWTWLNLNTQQSLVVHCKNFLGILSLYRLPHVTWTRPPCASQYNSPLTLCSW